MAPTLPCADGQRVAADLAPFAQFTAGGAGCNRTLFSSAYNESRSWVAERMTMRDFRYQ